MGGYCEDPNFVPDPMQQVRLVRTDGTSGDDNNMTHPVFDAAEARRVVVAARALDPDSPVDRGLVVLPGGNGGQTEAPESDDAARERILATAQEAVAANPAIVTADLRDGRSLVTWVESIDDDGEPNTTEPTVEGQEATDPPLVCDYPGCGRSDFKSPQGFAKHVASHS